MTDDFVKQAFAEADDAMLEREYAAYSRLIVEDESQSAHVVAALKVGLKRMDELCKAVIESGSEQLLAEYADALLLVGFHIGYTASREEA